MIGYCCAGWHYWMKWSNSRSLLVSTAGLSALTVVTVDCTAGVHTAAGTLHGYCRCSGNTLAWLLRWSSARQGNGSCTAAGMLASSCMDCGTRACTAPRVSTQKNKKQVVRWYSSSSVCCACSILSLSVDLVEHWRHGSSAEGTALGCHCSARQHCPLCMVILVQFPRQLAAALLHRTKNFPDFTCTEHVSIQCFC
jgi:hypothetical protein